MDGITKLVALTPAEFAAVIALFLPGFVSLKIHAFLIPGTRQGAAELLIDAVGYSLMNGAVFSWAIFIASAEISSASPNYWKVGLFALLICVVGPVLWPILLRLVQRYWIRGKLLLGEQKSAFDAYFSTNQPCWIIVHLGDGSRIAGYFGESSFASAHPHSGDFYLQELWNLDANGHFKGPIANSKGALFHRSDYVWLEFFWDGPSGEEVDDGDN